MRKEVHERLTTSLLSHFQVPSEERDSIIRNDTSQDDHLIDSWTHSGEDARREFRANYGRYQEDPTPEMLGKLLHYSLDLAAPVHFEGGRNVLKFIPHSQFESMGITFYDEEQIKAVTDSSITVERDIDLPTYMDHLAEFQRNTLERYTKIGEMIDDGFVRMPENATEHYMKLFYFGAKKSLFKTASHLDRFMKQADSEKYSTELSLFEMEFGEERVRELLAMDMDELLGIIEKRFEEEPEEDRPQVILHLMFYTLLALRKMFYECIEMACPLSVHLIRMRYAMER